MILSIRPDGNRPIDVITFINGQHLLQIKYSLLPCHEDVFSYKACTIAKGKNPQWVYFA